MARTGFTAADAQDDFLRARRRRALSRISPAACAREPGDVDVILPFEEVVAALGRTGERRIGLQVIPLDSIVGTVDRTPRLRPPVPADNRRACARAGSASPNAMRRGEPLPPIDVYRIGDMHFVRDGHHRVSVARALGRDGHRRLRHRGAHAHRRRRARSASATCRSRATSALFRERVPLPRGARGAGALTDPWSYGALAEGVEAWGFRAMQDRGDLMDREEVAAAWFERRVSCPWSQMLREAGLLGPAAPRPTPTCALGERYRLMRTHDWSEEIARAAAGGAALARALRGEARPAASPASNRWSLRGVEPQLDRPGPRVALLAGIQPRDDLARLAARPGRRPRRRPAASSCSSSDSAALALDAEVGVDLRAHRLDERRSSRSNVDAAARGCRRRARRPRSPRAGCRRSRRAPARRSTCRGAVASGSATSPIGSCTRVALDLAGRKFIAGEPMKPATNRLAGSS